MFLSQVFAKKMKNPDLFFLDYGLTLDESLFLRKDSLSNRNCAWRPREYGERLHTFAVAQGISVEYSSEIAPSRVNSCTGESAPHHPISVARSLSRMAAVWGSSPILGGVQPFTRPCPPRSLRTHSWLPLVGRQRQ
jgi:hypothetical protein